MSDIEISGSESEPVSDVNPEEMARLMADLDEMDDDLFKGTLKSTSTKKEDKDSKLVKLDEKTPPKNKDKTETPKKEGDEEDWDDADDLLHSDDEPRKGKAGQKPSAQNKTAHKLPSPGKTESPITRSLSGENNNSSPAKQVQSEENTNTKGNAKSKLMADVFREEASDIKKQSDVTSAVPGLGAKKDKSKLMADLFGDGDSSSPSNTKKSPINATKHSAVQKNISSSKKTKDEITFDDDDDDDLLGSLSDAKPKPTSVSNSPISGGFLDNLLAKSSTTENVKFKTKSPEFVLDDKYKNMSKEKKENKGFRGYVPSSEKLESPPKRTPKKSDSSDPFDFLGDAEPRRCTTRSGFQRKPYEIDDDDILGNVRPRRGRNKEQGKESEQISVTPRKSGTESPKSKNDSWLFGSPSNTDKTLKETIQETSIEASVERENGSKAKSPEKSQDWLGNLLSTSKKTPTKIQEGSTSANLPKVQQLGPGSENIPSNVNNAQKNSSSPLGMNDSQKNEFTESSGQQVKARHKAEDFQRTIYKEQQMSEAQSSSAFGEMKSQQEQLLQQQEANMRAAGVTASQMRLQQEQLEAQMSQQLLLQQQEMAKFQESATKRYQDMMMAASVGQLSLGNFLIDKDNQDEFIKELKIQLRSSEIEMSRVEIELELLRKQHSEEVAILEESHRRKHQMEKDVWDRTEQRLKEERSSLMSDFQAKVSALQLEKESLAVSYEAQLANVKKEWSETVDRTKQLYIEMTERMKAEHSAALERMTYLKDLELNAAIFASGHVKEVELVMNQLETNTANLSNLTASISTRHDSALEMTQKALKMKEKQLRDFEAELEASRAEAESERGRLNSLINRLENTLIRQGSEVEKEKWKLAQEQMKIEMERKALTEERRHVQMSTETERQTLASARDSLLTEHQLLLEAVARDKQELSSQRAQLSAHQKLANASFFGNNFSLKTSSHMDIDAEIAVLTDERRRLKEKMTSLIQQGQTLKTEEERIEQLGLKLEQDKAKFAFERDVFLQERDSLRKTQQEVASAHEASEMMRKEQQSRLSQITMQTQALHHQQEKMERERMRLEQLKVEINQLLYQGLCPSCQNRGITGSAIEFAFQNTNGRLPGDGGEGQSAFSKMEAVNTNMSPASVFARLAAARERENLEREKRLLQISALEFS